jgi:hypothetical protein
MKRIWYSFITIIVLLVLFFPVKSKAQFESYYQPRVMLGGNAARFRISLDSFEDIYDGRWGSSYGGFAGVRAFSANYLLFKYGSFIKDGKQGTHPETGLDLADARWEEKWYSVGMRLFPPLVGKFHSYYGFGISFFDVVESENLSVFENGTNKDDGMGNGFYLELGLDYYPVERIGAFFEMQVASGGVRGRTGFEAMSVGGFSFAAGITVLPF